MNVTRESDYMLFSPTKISAFTTWQTDLNSGPGSMPYGLQRSVAELGDAFAEANPTQTGHTYDTKTNVFAEGRCRVDDGDSYFTVCCSYHISYTMYDAPFPCTTTPLCYVVDCFFF